MSQELYPKTSQASTSGIPTTQAAPAYTNAVATSATEFARPARKRRKDRADRGLPHDGELVRLAQVYLELVAQLYPRQTVELLVSTNSAESISAMVENFKLRHRGGRITASRIGRDLQKTDLKVRGLLLPLFVRQKQANFH